MVKKYLKHTTSLANALERELYQEGQALHKNSSRYHFKKSKSQKVDSAFDFLKLVHNWEDIVGPRLNQYTCPLKNKYQTLTILTNHAAISQQISFMQEMIIQKIEKVFPSFKGQIKKIQFINDSTYFTQRKQELQKQEKALGKNKLNIKSSTHPRIHPQSPKYLAAKDQAQQLFQHVENPEIQKILISLFIQNQLA